MNNYIINFWYGRTALWKAYWIVGELFNALFLVLIFNIEVRFFNNPTLYKNLPFLDFTSFSLITKFALLIWTIFITVGIWRSAEAYKGKIIWSVLTLLFLSYRLFTLRIILY